LTDVPRRSLVVEPADVEVPGARKARSVDDAAAGVLTERSVLPLTLPYTEQLVFRGAADDPRSASVEVRLAPLEVLHLAASHEATRSARWATRGIARRARAERPATSRAGRRDGADRYGLPRAPPAGDDARWCAGVAGGAGERRDDERVTNGQQRMATVG